MQIEAKEVLYGDREKYAGRPAPYEVYKVEILKNGITFCCEEIRKAWDENFLQFGAADCDDKTTNGRVCINKRAWESSESTSINFCPFCGTKIEVKIVSTMKLTYKGKKKKSRTWEEDVYVEEDVTDQKEWRNAK